MDTGVNQFVFPSKIGAGSKALEHLPFDLSGFGAERPLIICNADLEAEGGLKPLLAAFNGSGLTLGLFTMEEASLEAVREAWGHYTDGGFDAVVAVGGGEVVDVAKCLAVAAGETPDALRNLLNEGGTVMVSAPLAWVPTLALTGREAAPEAQLEGRQLHGTALAPNLIAVDPRMLALRPEKGLAEAGLGALASALALYESGTVNPLASPYARLTVRQVMVGLEPLLVTPVETRGVLSRWFGMGANRSDEVAFAVAMAAAGSLRPEGRKSLTFVLAEVLAPVSRCSREVLAAVILPSVLEYAHWVKGVDLSEMLSALGDLDLVCATPVPRRAEAALALVREKINRLWLLTETELPRTLSEAGLERETLIGLCDEASAMAEGWQRHDVEALLLSAFDGTRPDSKNQPTPAIEEVS